MWIRLGIQKMLMHFATWVTSVIIIKPAIIVSVFVINNQLDIQESMR